MCVLRQEAHPRLTESASRYCTETSSTVIAAMLSAGLSLRWLRDQVFGLSGPDAYERMLGWAESALAGANGLLFLPYLAGERTPHMDPRARGRFLGLTAAHGRAAPRAATDAPRVSASRPAEP